LYGTPAPSAESQHLEAWPASTYGHLRGVLDNKKLLSGTLPDNKELLSGSLPDNNLFQKNMMIKGITSNFILNIAVFYSNSDTLPF